MSSESFKYAMKEVENRRQNALFAANIRNGEVCGKIPRVRELTQLLSQTAFHLSKVIFSEGKNAGQAIQKIMETNLRNQQELAVLLAANQYPEDYLDIQYTCKKCEDSGYIDGVKCECIKQLETKYNVTEFNSTNHIDAQSFATFSLQYYSDIPAQGTVSYRKVMSDILDSCKNYAAGFTTKSPSILMLGETGLGKTHLSLSIAREVMQNGFSALYSSAPDLFRKLQNEYYGKGEPGVDTMEIIAKADLVIIDDLGAEIENQFNVATLYNLINMRLNAAKPTIISTNLALKDIERRYTNRVASRLMALYKCLKFVGKDVRMIKLKKNEL